MKKVFYIFYVFIFCLVCIVPKLTQAEYTHYGDMRITGDLTVDGTLNSGSGITHAPSDNHYYGSHNGAWARINYDDLLNLPVIPTNNNQLINGAGYITGYTETDPVFTSWDKDYNDLINIPIIVDWTQASQGIISATNYVDNDTHLSDGDISAFGYIKLYTETDPIFSAWNKDYNDLINAPTIPTNNNQLSNGAGYITGYTETDPTAEPALGNPTVDDYILSSTTAGVRSWVAKPTGSGSTNLGYTPATSGGTVTSSTGSDAAIPTADLTNAGLFLPTEKDKLSGIGTGAQLQSVVQGSGVAIDNTDTQNPIISATGAITSVNSHTGVVVLDTTDLSDFATAVSNNTSVAANTAKVTNATHTGDVTGSTVLTIASGVVDTTMLSATGTPSSTTYLRGDNTWGTPTGGGDVTGPASSTDNYLVLYSGTTGKVIKQATGWYIDANGKLAGPGVASTAADGDRKLNVANSTTCSELNTVGDLCFDEDDGLWRWWETDATSDWLITNDAFTGNTETGITVTAQPDGTVDFVVDAVEGSAILSTGETGGTKFLREDGDGKSSWQTISGGSSSYVATPWTYSDEACTPGQYSLTEAYRYDCVASGNINRTALTDWNNPTPVNYTLTVTDPGNNDVITCSDSDLSVAIDCGGGQTDCSATATSGASITGITATAASGRQFDNFTDDLVGVTENPTTATNALTMDSNKTVGGAFSTVATEKMAWTVSSDTVETPSGKTAVSTAGSTYTTTGCYSGGTGGCYDAQGANHDVAIPIVSNDVIDFTNFDITFYVNPQVLIDYGYYFGIGSDSNNYIEIHSYADGRLYCRSMSSGTADNNWILDTAGDMVVGTWYKIRMVYVDGTSLVVYINDVEQLNDISRGTMAGTPTNIYFMGDYAGTTGIDAMLDGVVVK